MERIKCKRKITKDCSYGVYNITDGYVETHHRTEKAAKKQCKVRERHWRPDKTFKIVLIYN